MLISVSNLLQYYSMGINRKLEILNADATKQSLFPGSDSTRREVVRSCDRPGQLIVLSCWMDEPHRNVICSVSGQMCFLSVIQPQKILVKQNSAPSNPLLLLGACLGAEEKQPSFRSSRLLPKGSKLLFLLTVGIKLCYVADNSFEKKGPELLVLEKEGNIVNSVSVVNGARLSEFSVQYPHNFVDETDVLNRVIPPKESVTGKNCPITYNNALLLPSRSQDTVMSCAVYSSLCSCTVIGYQSGAICVFLPQNSIDSSSNNVAEHYTVFRFNTKEVF